MALILKACAERGCDIWIPEGQERCEAHAREHNARHNADRAARGLFSAEWRARRRRVLDRDSFVCRLNLPGCTRIATEVHLDPRFAGDHTVARDEDCVAACGSCNVYERNHRSGTAPVSTAPAVREVVFG